MIRSSFFAVGRKPGGPEEPHCFSLECAGIIAAAVSRRSAKQWTIQNGRVLTNRLNNDNVYTIDSYFWFSGQVPSETLALIHTLNMSALVYVLSIMYS